MFLNNLFSIQRYKINSSFSHFFKQCAAEFFMIAQVTATCHASMSVDKNIIWNSVGSELSPYRLQKYTQPTTTFGMWSARRHLSCLHQDLYHPPTPSLPEYIEFARIRSQFNFHSFVLTAHFQLLLRHRHRIPDLHGRMNRAKSRI